MKTHCIRCFGRTDDSGNVAMVVEESASSESERQEFARRQEANATVFMEVSSAGDIQLDYYYPHNRSPLCLHATLGASAVFFERHPDVGRVTFVTSMNHQALGIERADGDIFVGVNEQYCPTLTGDIAETTRLLGIEPTDLVRAPELASVGSAKLLVEVAEQSLLVALHPDLAGIADWSRANGVSGMYVYCRLQDDIYMGRNFNHLEPRFEDAATGVAAGALALSLRRSIALLQGDALGQPCTLFTRYKDGVVQIGGRAARKSI